MKFFRETAKVNGADSAANWGKLRESVARRNLIVHSGGVVNRTYLEDVPLTDRPGDSKTASVGTQLRVSPDYFTETLDEFLLAGSALTQCCWRKWHKTELDAADSELIDVLYQALLKERWRLAERIGEFAISCKTSSEENRLVLLFNYCISLKQLGSRDKLGSCIAKLDASALGPKFKAAVAALCDDKEALHKHLRDALATRVIEPSEIREWPLLREARSDPHFYERLGLAQSAPPKPALPSPELPGTAPVVVTNPPSAASRKP
jgi:hypothetical protein